MKMDMKCSDFEAWLRETSTERGRELPPEAEQHCASCPQCQDRWQAEVWLDLIIQEWQNMPLPEREWTLTYPLLKQTDHSERMHPPQSRWLQSGRVLAVSAVCLMLVLVTWSLRHIPEQPVSTVAVQGATPAFPVSESVTTLFAELHAAPQVLAIETARRIEQVPAVSEPEPTEVIPSPMPSIDSPSEQRAWWRWGAPIRNQVESAFGFLSQAVPPLPVSG